MDASGRIVHANKAEMALLGYEPEGYIGREIANFHADQPAIDDILGQLSGATSRALPGAPVRVMDRSATSR